MSDIIARARAEGRSALDEAAGKALLRTFGIRVPKSLVLKSATEATTALTGLAPPFAVKVVSRDILHKSDVGGVNAQCDRPHPVLRAQSPIWRRSPASPASPSKAGWLRR